MYLSISLKLRERRILSLVSHSEGFRSEIISFLLLLVIGELKRLIKERVVKNKIWKILFSKLSTHKTSC